MDTPEEMARDQWYSELVDDVSKQAIDEFALERLRSYYIANPNLVKDVVSVFKEAKKLIDISPSASLVLFTTAIELGLKTALLKPVIYGLVHNESVADLISDLVVRQNGFDRFKPLLAQVVSEYGGIDFDTFTIEGHEKTMWEEITVLQKARNGVVHRGELAPFESTILSRDVAVMIIGNYLPSVLGGLGLELKKGGTIGHSL
jgi:hypothetical protein